MFAASAFASRLILSTSDEPPRLASSILLSLRVRARTSSKFSIGPPNGSLSQPIRSLVQLNFITSVLDGSGADEIVCATAAVAVSAKPRATTSHLIAFTPSENFLAELNDTTGYRVSERNAEGVSYCQPRLLQPWGGKVENKLKTLKV